LESREQDQPIAIGQKSDLIVKLNNLIDDGGLDLITVRLEDGESGSSIGVQQNNSGTQQNNSDYSYQQVPILIEIDGTYSEIVNLVNQIEELKYLIKVNNLNLNTNNQEDLAPDSETNIKAQLKLVAFATDDRKGR
ncbi:MAG: type 4a pilus biogenesis protein PilO, partial [Bacillota bacterium]